MRYIVSVSLIIVGVIHLLPLSGVLGHERLSSLYGLTFSEPNLSILMRHRAVLFGLLGLFMIIAAFVPMFQTAAFVAGFISVLSFLYLAWSTGGFNSQIERVFVADIIALVSLVIGGVIYTYIQFHD